MTVDFCKVTVDDAETENPKKPRGMWPIWWVSGEERELPSVLHVQNSRSSKLRSVTNTSASFPYRAFDLLKGPTVGFMKGEQCSCVHSPHQHCGLPLPYLWNENESGCFLLVAEVNCVNCVVSGPTLSERHIKTSILMLTSALQTSLFTFLQFVLSSSDCGLNRATADWVLAVACGSVSWWMCVFITCLCLIVCMSVCRCSPRGHAGMSQTLLLLLWTSEVTGEHSTVCFQETEHHCVAVSRSHKAKQVTAFSSGQHWSYKLHQMGHLFRASNTAPGTGITPPVVKVKLCRQIHFSAVLFRIFIVCSLQQWPLLLPYPFV